MTELHADIGGHQIAPGLRPHAAHAAAPEAAEDQTRSPVGRVDFAFIEGEADSPCRPTELALITVSPNAFGLPQIFSPADAAQVLRDLGLTEMTECALRARAYRQQVPCHLNGRRIIFTLGDLHEIAEGQPRRPRQPAERTAPARISRPIMRRSPSPEIPQSPAWRARRPQPNSAPPEAT